MQLVKCDKALLKSFVNILINAGRVEEASLIFSEDGIRCRVLDPSHVAMVDVHLAAADLVDSSLNGETIQVGVWITKLRKALSLVSSKIVALDYDDKRKVLILRAGRVELEFGLVDTGILTEVRIPNIEFPATVVAKAEDIVQAVKATEMVADLVTIEMTKDSINFTGKDEKDNVKVEIPDDDLEEIKVSDGESFKSQYDLEFLLQALKETKGNVKLLMGTDIPIRVECNFGENSSFFYFLAPRVEGD